MIFDPSPPPPFSPSSPPPQQSPLCLPPPSQQSLPPTPPPSSTRLRHSSTPHSLPSTWSPGVQLTRPFCFEAEDATVPCLRASWGLAGWEERVLRAREERHWRRLRKIALVSACAKDAVVNDVSGAKALSAADQNVMNAIFAGKVGHQDCSAVSTGQLAEEDRRTETSPCRPLHILTAAASPACSSRRRLTEAVSGCSSSSSIATTINSNTAASNTPRSPTTPSKLKSDCYETEPERQLRLQTTSICYNFCIPCRCGGHHQGRRRDSCAAASANRPCCRSFIALAALQRDGGANCDGCGSIHVSSSPQQPPLGHVLPTVAGTGKRDAYARNDSHKEPTTNLQNGPSASHNGFCCWKLPPTVVRPTKPDRTNLPSSRPGGSLEDLSGFGCRNGGLSFPPSMQVLTSLARDNNNNKTSDCCASCSLYAWRGRRWSQPFPLSRTEQDEKLLSGESSPKSAQHRQNQCFNNVVGGVTVPQHVSNGGLGVRSDNSKRSGTDYSLTNLADAVSPPPLQAAVSSTVKEKCAPWDKFASREKFSPRENFAPRESAARTPSSCARQAAASRSRRGPAWSTSRSPVGHGGGLLTGLLMVCLVTVSSASFISSEDSIIPNVCKEDINVRHNTDFSSLVKYENCTVLEGSLMINSVLKDYQKAWDKPPFTFPNLVEITDFLLLFRANQIGNLSRILPRLAVIRGDRLVHNSALAVYQMKNLNSLGLHSLTSIMKGGVRIEKNPALCYVDTIRWNEIVMDEVVIKNDHIFIEENMDSRDCLETCDDNCNGNCWDPDHCQIKRDKCNGDSGGLAAGSSGVCYRDGTGQLQLPCSSECLGGCTQPNSPEHCFACRNVWYTSNNRSVCVDKCPQDFLSYKEWKCISASECMSLRNPVYKVEEEKFYKIHTVNQNTKQCVNSCPANFEAVKDQKSGAWECQPCEDCPRPCDGGVINSREEAEAFRHCTIVLGDIEIRVSESDISPVLEKTMKDIKIIEGTFKVSRSFALVSLHFFQSLEEIQNKFKEEFAITVMENHNLQKLFPRDVKVNFGHGFFHYNQKLCMSEIDEFLETAGIQKEERRPFDVSGVTNGNKAACSKEKLKLVIYNVFSRIVYFNMTDFRHNLAVTKSEDLNALIGYEIFYREITEEQFKERKVSRYEGLDACGSNIWSVIDMRPSPRNSTQHQRLDSIADWYTEPERGMLHDLKPYTPYAVYANTLMVPHLSTNATGAQSDVVYFRTGSEPPKEVQRLKWRSKSESSLSITWRPPKQKYGIIDHYEVQVELIQLDTEKMLLEKNYCDIKSKVVDKIAPAKNADKQKDVVKPATGARNDSASCPVCSCDSATDKTEIPDRGEDHIDEQLFYNDLINKIFTMPSPQIVFDDEEEEETEDNSAINKSRKKRSILSGRDSGGNRLVDDNGLDSRGEESSMFVVRKINKIPEVTPWSNKTDRINGTRLYAVAHLIVKDTEVVIDSLKHFSQYQVKVMACHKKYWNAERNRTQKFCSPWTIAEAMTLSKPGADDIVMENDEIDIYMANETTGKTFMRWIPPSDPNQMIIHYTVRTTKTLSDESTNNFLRCIPLSALETLENGWVQTTLKREGEIWVSLRAVSTYGPGKWTKWQWAMVNSNNSYTWIVVVVVLVLVCILCVGTLLYWKQKKQFRSGPWDYVSPNPDYLDTGYVYQQDEWEVARELITKGEELGSGSFGVCYRGIYNNPDKGPIPVAIKSVPDHATFRQRIEFLTEASVMKDINTEYVVRLIGVVSQGQPTLVLMELMENGDLRKYLRNLRPDVRDETVEPPTLQRTLQMALEIADGMAYLSVRKYVHRDLAARNCLVSSNFVVKVGDFGMAQDVYEKEYYRTEGRRLLPVRWMAPESLRDGKFTSKSDVWSYGVVLWEMATLAEQPYQGWGNDEVVTYVKDGSIMPRPDNCPDRLYDLMRDCWQRNEDQRPSFLDICERLLPEANEHYRSNSFYLSSQGVEAMANQRAHREQAELNTHNTTPLTNNGGTHSDNNGSVTTNGGDTRGSSAVPAATTSAAVTPANNNGSSGGGGGPTISFRSSPTHISFSGLTGGLRQSASKTTANGLGVIQRLRNKSGSSSGNAA